MLSYHSDPAIKSRYLARVEGHAAADEILKGQYWEAGKGCAVGCTVHGADHVSFEQELGIPRMLAWLEDIIFEGLPNRRAKSWPLEFLTAIEPGRHLSPVGWQFLYWLLAERDLPEIDNASVRHVVMRCADALERLARGQPVNQGKADAAAAEARALLSLPEAKAGPSAPAAWILESAALAAESAALSATCATSSAERAGTAVSAAVGRSADYIALGDKLLALLRAA